MCQRCIETKELCESLLARFDAQELHEHERQAFNVIGEAVAILVAVDAEYDNPMLAALLCDVAGFCGHSMGLDRKALVGEWSA